ncbi:MAG: MATE family efflux transporter [Oscillospiraceae bacterium]|nr:MATE family efflux transporter [Oscillospiraceae bacterium]
MFEQQSIGKLMLKFSLPAIISMVVNSIYNIVDQIFIGWGVGYLGNAATNVAFPLMTVAMALSTLICDGCVAYFSLKLGEKRYEEAARTMGNGVMIATVTGLTMFLLGEIFLSPILKLCGATENVFPYAKDYVSVTLLGYPLVFISMTISSLIRAEGNPRYSMICMLTGCITNIVLDALFVLGFDWGVKGAAWATVIGQFLNFCLCLAYIPRFRDIRFKLENMKPRRNVLGAFLPLGISSLFTQMSFAVLQVCMNNQLVKYGALSIYGPDIPLAAFGIVMKVNSIIISVLVGISIGSQPIVGYNYGAKNYDRVKKTYLRTILVGSIVAVLGWCCFQLFPQNIVNIFGQESELYNQFAVLCFRRFLITVCLAGITVPTGIFFQSIGKPVIAMISSMVRPLVFFIPALFFLTSRMGIDGALWAGPISDLLAFLLVSTLAIIEMRKLTATE